MSVNSSSSFSDGLLHSNVFSINSSLLFYINCLSSRPSSILFTAFTITDIFLLIPLCIYILYQGWKKYSTSSAATMSHTDIFTYHVVSIELIGVLGCISCYFGIYREDLNVLIGGILLTFFTWFGQTFFHILTCVKHYLAVVHPIIYVSLRTERGVRIHNICIGCVWLLCFVGMGLTLMENLAVIVGLGILVLALISVSFCSFSVLCVLIHPGPGEQGGDGGRVDRAKLRAFYTIVTILGVLVLRFAFGLVWITLYTSGRKSDCMIIASNFCFNLPSSLVLPLQFMLRAEKLMCCKKTSE